MIGLGRDAADLADSAQLREFERLAYRAAIERVGRSLRWRCATMDELAVAFYLSNDELLGEARVACRSTWSERLSPVVVLNAAIFELAQELSAAA